MLLRLGPVCRLMTDLLTDNIMIVPPVKIQFSQVLVCFAMTVEIANIIAAWIMFAGLSEGRAAFLCCIQIWGRSWLMLPVQSAGY